MKGNYNLSARAQYDMVGVYKYGIKFFGLSQAVKYSIDIEEFLEELAVRPELAKDASTFANALKYYRFKSHVIFYMFEGINEIFVVRILGKRMNFIEHLGSSFIKR